MKTESRNKKKKNRTSKIQAMISCFLVEHKVHTCMTLKRSEKLSIESVLYSYILIINIIVTL